MASLSIETRKLANKEQRFKAVIIVKNKEAIIHRESKTFKKKNWPELGEETKPKS